MEKLDNSLPRLTFRDVVRGMLKGASHIGTGMARIGEGEYQIADGMARINLTEMMELNTLPITHPMNEDIPPVDHPE